MKKSSLNTIQYNNITIQNEIIIINYYFVPHLIYNFFLNLFIYLKLRHAIFIQLNL